MIIHVDMDAFYASVEQHDRPELKGQPVVVGGSPTGRGVISAASYEARQHGVYSAMPAAQALRRCPGLVFVKSRMARYAAVSRQIREIFFRFSSLVEPLSLDEAFLDVSGCERLFGDAPSIARTIKTTILAETGLVASVGVAPNKYLAKVASDLHKPDGFLVVPPEHVEAFLENLTINRVWGVGPKTAARFQKLGVQRIGQLRTLSMADLESLFGNHAEHYWRLARGIDERPVIPDRNAKTVSHETTFAMDIDDDHTLSAWAVDLSDQVARRLRRHRTFGKTVQLKIRYQDFRTCTRACTLRQATHSTSELASAVLDLLQTERQRNQESVRLLGVAVSHLSLHADRQMTLFDGEQQARDRRIDSTLDAIRDRFGGDAFRRASSLAHRVGRVNLNPNRRIDPSPPD